MIAVDTSVVVAAFGDWHVHHATALAVLDRKASISAQAALEAYAVLTRLPPPYRADPQVAHAFLDRNFGGSIVGLPDSRIADLLVECARTGIAGGATYDAVIAATARERGQRLVTLDARARATYEKLGTAVEYISA